MNDTEDDGHFHLVRVGEDESVVRAVPVWVEAERVGVSGRLGKDEAGRVGRPFPAGLPDVQRLGEDVVVHEPGEHGEGAHEDDDVATAVNRECGGHMSCLETSTY